MKHIQSINEFLGFFKKRVDKGEFSLELIRDLIESDLDNVRVHTPTRSITSGVKDAVDITNLIKLSTCRFKPARSNWAPSFSQVYNNHPKLNKDKLYGEIVEYSETGHRNGVDGYYLTIDMRNPNGTYTAGSGFTLFNLIKHIYESLNSERMAEFGIGFCLNKHHFIGDSIIFYQL